jgi:hypothetical protein
VQLELERRAVGEALAEGDEELVDLLLAVGVAPRPEDADRLVARPERTTGRRVAAVQCALRVMSAVLTQVRKSSRSVMRAS